MEYIKAFLVGGAICGAVQILMDTTKLLPGRIMVILVCLGSLLGALGIYQTFSDWAGAGASVPLTGFGNVLFHGVKKSID
ncbi:MAG TPA: SpoVA/SpoVAEb family sporulation membrane protein, partial [Clostridiales bacterium]|nr:SpoVA/SpoVAEb family sporulation membrane protein [Clostridiales bacterium]